MALPEAPGGRIAVGERNREPGASPVRASVHTASPPQSVGPPESSAFGGGVTIDDFSVVTVLSGIRSTAPVVDAKGTPVGWSGVVFGLAGLPQNTPYHVYVTCA